jgi:hypothetical protein
MFCNNLWTPAVLADMIRISSVLITVSKFNW